MKNNTYNLPRLFHLLNARRPYGTEQATADWLFDGYNAICYRDKQGAPMCWAITTLEGKTDTLFTAHLDTVHSAHGQRKVNFDRKTGIVSSPDGTPLGADDGAGVWLLMEMIDAKVPGMYFFFAGEERGGVGSKWLAEHHPEWLAQFSHAVAFDRRGSYDVITHQAMGRCCSDAFGEALADSLNEQLPDDYALMVPNDGGIYTDTAEFAHLIAECTNVSVGYDNEHTSKETLDLTFLLALRIAVLRMDWEILPTERTPKAVEYEPYVYGWGSGPSGRYRATDADDLLGMSPREMRRYIETTDSETLAGTIDDLLSEILELREQQQQQWSEYEREDVIKLTGSYTRLDSNEDER